MLYVSVLLVEVTKRSQRLVEEFKHGLNMFKQQGNVDECCSHLKVGVVSSMFVAKPPRYHQ
jgi:hypothetical protein